MQYGDYINFLKWALPFLGLRWNAFRKAYRQVCRRLAKRMSDLGISTIDAYRMHIEADPDEWKIIDGLCRITISRLYRDGALFEIIEKEVVPCLAGFALDNGSGVISCLSLGCASGEEVYSLNLLWQERLQRRYKSLALNILALDADETMLARAGTASYARGSVKEVPADLLDRGFVKSDGEYRLRDTYRGRIVFLLRDVRDPLPQGPFHLVLCRNLVFTYFDDVHQREAAAGITNIMAPGGFLVVGRHETVPAGSGGLVPYAGNPMIYQKQ
jgi:chemotaxis protein methyltransferase CheR